MPVQQLVAEILFVRTSYVKKIIEDCSNSEETVKLLRFSCWENPQFSSTVLSELLWQVRVRDVSSVFPHWWDVQNPLKLILKVMRVQVAYSYTYELRPYLDLLLQILLIEDSWQTHRSDRSPTAEAEFRTVFVCPLHSFSFTLLCRIHNVLKGIPDDRDGLFDTIQRSKNHYQKRAYQCIKCMVALFSNCSVAYQILQVGFICLLF